MLGMEFTLVNVQTREKNWKQMKKNENYTLIYLALKAIRYFLIHGTRIAQFPMLTWAYFYMATICTLLDLATLFPDVNMYLVDI